MKIGCIKHPSSALSLTYYYLVLDICDFEAKFYMNEFKKLQDVCRYQIQMAHRETRCS